VAVPAHARERLEHVCRYVLRPSLALERLSESSHGQLLYELGHPRADGSTHVLLDPLELLEKLAVLVPAPRTHLLRYHGVLAPAAAWRSLIVPRPVADGGGQASAGMMGEPAGELSSSAAGPARPARPDWAALLKRVFALDVLHCPRCGGRRRIVAVHTRPETLRPLLARLGLDGPAASPRASRSPPA
jgi:Putative transposase